MLKQSSYAAMAAFAILAGVTSQAAAFSGYLPNVVLAATSAEQKDPLFQKEPKPSFERPPLVVRIGNRAHLFDGYFYCEMPRNPLSSMIQAKPRYRPQAVLTSFSQN